MSTRSSITIKADGAYRSVYCHFDGYIEDGVGQMLLEHYNTEAKVLALLEVGDIRTLGPSIEESEFFQGEGTEAIFCAEYSDVMEYNSRNIITCSLMVGGNRILRRRCKLWNHLL